MYIEKLASAIRNDVVSGLRGYHQNLALNLDQLEDEIVQCRLQIIHQNFLKGILPIKDLILSINCIDVDCESLERCSCKGTSKDDTLVAHFQIPQLISFYGKNAIQYIGSTDRLTQFNIITSLAEFNNKKYRRRGKNKPYVWIDYSPNYNGMLDCFLFNAPLLKQVSIVAAFKDPRQLRQYSCCNQEQLVGPDVNVSPLDQLIKDKLVKEKLYYYRQMSQPTKPNTQEYITGNGN